MICMMNALFTKLFEFDFFKQLPLRKSFSTLAFSLTTYILTELPLVDFYVTKVLTKDVQLLNKPEVFAFFPKLFAQVES